MTASPESAAPLVPSRLTLAALRRAAAGCTACELHRLGTQTVFGEGPSHSRVMMIGEQPGDREDREGHPFVGPAGQLLDRSLDEAGVARDEVYLTNVVKHFRWEATRGKRRIHRKPSLSHVAACRPWLDAELTVVRPEIVVCLGATAAQAIVGRAFRLTEHRGELLDVEGMEALVAATVHPSSILRAPDDESRRREREEFVRDLVAVRRALEGERTPQEEGGSRMPQKKHGNVKKPKQYEGLRKKGMSKERAARIANSPGASSRGGKSGSKRS